MALMESCRACRGGRLHHVLSLGEQPLANGFLRAADLAAPEPLFPLEVFACLDCALIQVADQIPAGFFHHYLYVPSASETMRSHFAALAARLAVDHPEVRTGLAVDVGSND